MRCALRAALAAGMLVGALGTSTVRAQPRADADALFQEGRTLFQQQRYAEACDKLAASDALEVSVGTRGLLAACHERRGMVATAQREYAETAELARRTGDNRGSFARDRAQALEARVPRLTPQLSQGVPASAQITIDGSIQAVAGRSAAVDPGEHTVEVRTGEGQSWRVSVKLAEGDRTTVVLAPGASSVQTRPTTAPNPPTRDASARSSGARTAGFVALGVGAAGLAAAAITGGVVLAKKSQLDDACPVVGGTRACNSDGSAIRQQLAPLLVVNAIAWGVAIVGLGAGTTLLVVGSSSSHTAGAAVRARF